MNVRTSEAMRRDGVKPRKIKVRKDTTKCELRMHKMVDRHLWAEYEARRTGKEQGSSRYIGTCIWGRYITVATADELIRSVVAMYRGVAIKEIRHVSFVANDIEYSEEIYISYELSY